jgi:hypothetical protein
MTVWRSWGFNKSNLWRQNKRHAACAADFVGANPWQTAPIPFEELVKVMRTSFVVDASA